VGVQGEVKMVCISSKLELEPECCAMLLEEMGVTYEKMNVVDFHETIDWCDIL
jgi:hypothetical protein